MLTAHRLREVLLYDPETGYFRWRVRPNGRATSNWFAGTEHGSGYLLVTIDGKNYRAHRLAWLYVTGEWPTATIDHKNRIKSDNRWDNLRDASIQHNSQNRDGTVERRDRKKGVMWRARITMHGRLVTVGTFASKEEAEAARVEAKKQMHCGYIPTTSPDKTKGPVGP